MSLLYLASFLSKTHAMVSAFSVTCTVNMNYDYSGPSHDQLSTSLDMNISVIIPW